MFVLSLERCAVSLFVNLTTAAVIILEQTFGRGEHAAHVREMIDSARCSERGWASHMDRYAMTDGRLEDHGALWLLSVTPRRVFWTLSVWPLLMALVLLGAVTGEHRWETEFWLHLVRSFGYWPEHLDVYDHC